MCWTGLGGWVIAVVKLADVVPVAVGVAPARITEEFFVVDFSLYLMFLTFLSHVQTVLASKMRFLLVEGDIDEVVDDAYFTASC